MPAHSHSMRQRSSAHKRHVFFLVCFFLLLLAVGLFFLIKALFFTTPPWERKASFPSTATSSNPLSAKNPGIHLYSLDAMLRGDTVFQNTDSLILVNHVYTLSQEPSSLVYEESGEFAMTEDTLEAYLLMKEQADANSAEPLGIISSYRTAEEQTYLYETNPYAAPVWESEHQTGLALDLRSPYYAGEYFLESQVGQWVKENCWDFGFILRYPEEQEEATGITYEPWHYRYVGLPHSLIMEENGFILEDYLFSLPTGTVITWENWGILAVDEEEDASFSLPAGFKNAWISPDNTGRYILWWEQ